MFKLIISHLAFLTLTAMLMSSCNKTSQSPTGSVHLTIAHKVGNAPLELNKLLYQNAAGNHYLVTEVQWFVSHLSLIRPDGTTVELNQGEPLYFDTGIPASLDIKLDAVPAATYSGLRFIFGLDEQMNTNLRYTNPPESFMFWPEYLGGGYHYMKLNGKWVNSNGLLEPFNFHLGIGQIYDTTAPKSAWVNMTTCCKSAKHCEGYSPQQETMPITGFVHNYFKVNLPASIIVNENKSIQLTLIMNIDQWFREPHIYDHNQWGGSIMQKQAAMKMGCENGHNVFNLTVSDPK